MASCHLLASGQAETAKRNVQMFMARPKNVQMTFISNFFLKPSHWHHPNCRGGLQTCSLCVPSNRQPVGIWQLSAPHVKLMCLIRKKTCCRKGFCEVVGTLRGYMLSLGPETQPDSAPNTVSISCFLHIQLPIPPVSKNEHTNMHT